MADYSLNENNILRSVPHVLEENDATKPLAQLTARELAEYRSKIELVKIYASIDELPEGALDLLAEELGTQYYDTSFEIDTKRVLIKNTLLWYKQAGTLAAVRDLAESLFGTCEIEEWFDYAGTPGCFRIRSAELLDVAENLGAFLAAIERVKRHSAHLESIDVTPNYDLTAYIGHALQTVARQTMTMAEFSTDDFVDIYVNSSGDFFTDSAGNIYVRG